MAAAEVCAIAVVERVYPIRTSLGVGILMGAEALGNLVTPFVLPCTGSNRRRMRLALAASYVVTTAGFALYTVGPWVGGFSGYGINVAGALLAGVGWALQYVRAFGCDRALRAVTCTRRGTAVVVPTRD